MRVWEQLGENEERACKESQEGGRSEECGGEQSVENTSGAAWRQSQAARLPGSHFFGWYRLVYGHLRNQVPCCDGARTTSNGALGQAGRYGRAGGFCAVAGPLFGMVA